MGWPCRYLLETPSRSYREGCGVPLIRLPPAATFSLHVLDGDIPVRSRSWMLIANPLRTLDPVFLFIDEEAL
jgi:hypothetical protein